MQNSLLLAEKNFQDFLSIVQSWYQDGKQDASYVKKLVTAYQSMPLSGSASVFLYDHISASIFYITKNVDQYFYTPDTIIKWGAKALFKLLHYSHYSFALQSIRLEAKFIEKYPKEEAGNIMLYCCGLKIKDGKGNQRRVFLQGKQLQTDQSKKTSLSVFFLEDITHLIKGDHYWCRFESSVNSLAYVQQKGKKIFNDILSKREQEIIELIAQSKTSQEIAENQGISKLTVETHRKNMIKRLGAKDSTALIHLCKMSNLLTKIY